MSDLYFNELFLHTFVFAMYDNNIINQSADYVGNILNC